MQRAVPRRQSRLHRLTMGLRLRAGKPWMLRRNSTALPRHTGGTRPALCREMERMMAEGDVTLDTSDVDKWVGKPIIFAEFWDPCNATDIRRWVQAMDYANPLHWDENRSERCDAGVRG